MKARAHMANVCFVVDGERILLLQWVKKFYQGFWSGVGGGVEAGETPEQAVRREVFEESGLTLQRLHHRGNVLTCPVDGQDPTSLDIYVADQWSGDLRGSEEGLPQWVGLADLDQHPLIPFVRPFLPLVLEPDTFTTGYFRLDGQAVRSYHLEQFRVAHLRAVSSKEEEQP